MPWIQWKATNDTLTASLADTVMPQNPIPFVPASEIFGEPHVGVAAALEALITSISEAKDGDIVAVGASLVLTPDDLLFSDAGLSVYRATANGGIVSCDVLDGMTQNYDSNENQILRSLHFILNADYFFESDLREAALEISSKRTRSLSLEFIMLGDALLLSKSDLRGALLSRVGTGDSFTYLGDVVRSLWFAPTQYPDRKSEYYAAKSIKAFLEGYIPLRNASNQKISIHVPFPEWQECTETSESFPLLQTWNVNVA